MNMVRPLMVEDVTRDLDAFLLRVQKGEILERVESVTMDSRIKKVMDRASRMVKRYCHQYLAANRSKDDVDDFLAVMAMDDPEAFIRVSDSRSACNRFIAILVGRMVRDGIFLRKRQMRLAAALSEKIDTMDEKSIYKRINEGYNMCPRK